MVIPVLEYSKEDNIPVIDMDRQGEEQQLFAQGGPGSGFRGHAGRIGKVGGSSPSSTSTVFKREKREKTNIDPEAVSEFEKFKKRAKLPKNLTVEQFAQRAWGLEDPDSGLRTTIDEIYGEDGSDSINFVGKIVDRDGKARGYWERYLYTDRAEVNNDSFSIDDTAFQGKGFGGKFYYHSERELQKMGVKKISLETGLEVGGYAWARVGFDFAYRKDAEYLSDEFRSYWKEETGDPFPYKKKLLTPWEIASAAGPYENVSLGKKFLLGEEWSGIKVLEPTSTGYKVGQKYYKAKGYK